MQYNDLIMRFMYESIPLPKVAEEIKFEAVSNEVLGTKQRRFGPMPSPEVQVAVRDIIRRSGRLIKFFIPWASCKQSPDQGLDVAEFCALKQLHCLQEGLRRYGYDAKFMFRIEDNTDMYLFGPERFFQITEYGNKLANLIKAVLPTANWQTESSAANPCLFKDTAESYALVFYKYLKGEADVKTIHDLGWKGHIPHEQREYYMKQYKVFYPGKDHLAELSKYFAATLARIKCGMTCTPLDEHIQITFSHPVPCNPIGKNRLYYRTIPEKCTHSHKSPWLAKGIFRAGDVEVKPRFYDNESNLVKNTIEFAGVSIEADYILE